MAETKSGNVIGTSDEEEEEAGSEESSAADEEDEEEEGDEEEDDEVKLTLAFVEKKNSFFLTITAGIGIC